MSNTPVEEDEFDLNNHSSRSTFNTEKFQNPVWIDSFKSLGKISKERVGSLAAIQDILYACNCSLRLFKHGHNSLGRMHGVRGSSHYVGGNSAIH